MRTEASQMLGPRGATSNPRSRCRAGLMLRLHVIAATVRDIAEHFGIDLVLDVGWTD
jgi:hypothetical protein